MPKLGQHFLKNTGALSLIAKSLEITEGDILIEIGPGHGELTEKLKAESLKLKALKILAVEKDLALAELLRKKFSGDIEVVEGDALKKLSEVVTTLSGKTYKIVGNIPYYITGKLLRIIGELAHKPTISIFTIQKEVAERIIARAPRMNRLAASVAFWGETKIISRLSRTDFDPPPKVDSAMLRIETLPPRQEIMEEAYYRAVRTLFSQPRKTILNNLATEKTHTKEYIKEQLKNIGIEPEARPQNLTIENILSIAKII